MKNLADQKLLTALEECIVACNHCFSECLKEDDVKSMADCIRLDVDCAEMCTLVHALISRNSPHGVHLLAECIEVCNACAEACEKHAAHMDHCKVCAEACRACAKACEAYAA